MYVCMYVLYITIHLIYIVYRCYNQNHRGIIRKDELESGLWVYYHL